MDTRISLTPSLYEQFTIYKSALGCTTDSQLLGILSQSLLTVLARSLSASLKEVDMLLTQSSSEPKIRNVMISLLLQSLTEQRPPPGTTASAPSPLEAASVLRSESPLVKPFQMPGALLPIFCRGGSPNGPGNPGNPSPGTLNLSLSSILATPTPTSILATSAPSSILTKPAPSLLATAPAPSNPSLLTTPAPTSILAATPSPVAGVVSSTVLTPVTGTPVTVTPVTTPKKDFSPRALPFTSGMSSPVMGGGSHHYVQGPTVTESMEEEEEQQPAIASTRTSPASSSSAGEELTAGPGALAELSKIVEVLGMGEETQQEEVIGKLTAVVKDLVDNTDMSVSDVLALMQGSRSLPHHPTWLPIKPTVTRARSPMVDLNQQPYPVSGDALDKKNNTCETCHTSFSQFSSLLRHIRQVHQKIKDKPCVLCGERFARSQYLPNHIWRTHYNRAVMNVKCFFCPEILNTKEGIQKHLWLNHVKARR